MIDIHCHILPDFDDGAADLAESLQMARMAVSSGTTGIVVTPHFLGEAASLRQIPGLLDRYEQLKRAIAREGIPLKLYLGSEILCLPETPQLAARHALPTIGNTHYLLTEFYFNEPASYMDEMLESLAQLGYTPVVAHPERYKAVQQDLRLAERWFARGHILQVNKGSLLGAFGPRVRHTGQGILNEGLAHLIASDAHGSDQRTPHMGLLRQWLDENCDPEYAEVLLERNPARIVAGQEVVPVR